MLANLQNEVAATQAEFQAGIPMGITNPLTGEDLPLPTWLSVAEGRRVFQIGAWRLLFAGKHRDYFFTENRTQHEFKAAGQIASRVLYITENLPGRTSLKYADLLFGEELAIESAQESAAVEMAVARLVENSKFHSGLYEASSIASWAGSAWMQFYMRDGKVVCENVQPENVFPDYTPGTRDLRSATIKYLIMLKGERYVRMIHHRPGAIEHHLYRLKDDGQVGAEVDVTLADPTLRPVQPTGIKDLTIVELPNFAPCGLGTSDYDGAESLIDEVNNRRTQISRVLDIHGDPALLVLANLFNERTGEFRVSGRALPVDDMTKGDPVKYLTWDAKLEVAFRALTEATLGFSGQMDMSPMLLGINIGATSAETAKKFKLQISQTTARVGARQPVPHAPDQTGDQRFHAA